MCELASDEQYDCMEGQSKGCVDIPPYNRVPDGSVSEDWDTGMITQISYLLYLAIAVIYKLYNKFTTNVTFCHFLLLSGCQSLDH